MRALRVSGALMACLCGRSPGWVMLRTKRSVLRRSGSTGPDPWRTVIPIERVRADRAIKQEHQVFLIGSCFSENLGAKFADLKFRTDSNPFGIQYNPISIASCVSRLLEGCRFTEEDLGYDGRQYFSFDHHSSFSHPDKDQCLSNINTRFEQSRAALLRARYVFVTLGTAWAFQYTPQGGRIVANCHKLRGSDFSRRLLTPHEICEATMPALSRLKEANAGVQVVFTVSPVRHWKDGPVSNSRSKAQLLVAVHEMIHRHPEWASYFPSYEVVMDELRDYRFYEPDMLHPSRVAVDYIWQRLCDAYVDDSPATTRLMTEVERVRRAVMHKPFDVASEAHQRFVRQQLEAITRLEAGCPVMDFVVEKRKLRDQLRMQEGGHALT